MGIHYLSKPATTPCKYECAEGCAVYETRPEECMGFRCSWLAGYTSTDEQRPDKIGLVATAAEKYARPLGYKLLLIYEVSAGAYKEAPAQEWMTDMLNAGWLLLLRSTKHEATFCFYISASFSEEAKKQLAARFEENGFAHRVQEVVG